MKDAARIAGVSRPTIYRYVSEGRLSVTQDERGVKRVDPAELKRVFPGVSFETGPESPKRKTETGPDRSLEVELRGVRELLQVTRDELQAAKDRELKLLGVVEAQTRLLEDKRPKPTEAQEGPGSAGWFAGGILAALALVVAFLVTR